jgi:hypothetical protein
MRAFLLSSVLLALVGCGAPMPTPTPPAAPDVAPPAIDWLTAGQPPVAPPEIPWMDGGSPLTSACPASWSVTEDRCAPWPTAIPACAGATMRAPGDAACRPISPSCPTTDFASGLPAGAVYVLAGAPAGGDGSLSLPFATLAEALASAGAGATIALSRGDHVITGTIALDASLVGACASETRVVGEASARLLIGSAISIEDLTVSPGAANDPIYVTGVVDVAIRRVLLDGGQGYGITASDGAQLSLEDVRVANVGVRVDPAAPPYSAGIAAQQGGVLEGTRVVVDGATWVGASAEDASRVTLVDSVLRGTHEDAALSDSAGATCWSGGTLELTRTVVESNVSRGIEVLARCVTTRLDDVVVRGTRPGGSALAYGMVLGAPVVAHGLVLEANAESAIVSLIDGRAELTNVVVDHVTGEGTGIGATLGGGVVLHGAILRGVTAGLYAADAGTIEAEDVRISNVAGPAVQSISGVIVVRRAHVSDVSTGLFSGGTDATVTASDVVVERVGAVGQADSDAFTARAGGHIDVQRARVVDAMGAAVSSVQPGAVATVSDITCTGGSVAFDAVSGSIEVTSAVVDAPTQVGARATVAGGRVVLTDTWIHDVVVRGPRTGPALIVTDGGALDLHGVLVERAAYGIVAEVSAIEEPTPRIDCADAVFRELSVVGIDLSAASVDLARVGIEATADVALVARGVAVEVTLADLTIRDPMGRADGRLGRGVQVASGASVEGSRVTITRALGVALLASDIGTRLTLEDVWIDETEEEACGAACADRAAGHGVVSIFDASVALTNVRVSRSAWAGVLVSDGGLISLTNGFVDGNRVGRALLGPPPLGLTEQVVIYSANEVLEARAEVVVPSASLL